MIGAWRLRNRRATLPACEDSHHGPSEATHCCVRATVKRVWRTVFRAPWLA